jgi:hypothetical protein
LDIYQCTVWRLSFTRSMGVRYGLRLQVGVSDHKSGVELVSHGSMTDKSSAVFIGFGT